jgi:hypothetical protein
MRVPLYRGLGLLLVAIGIGGTLLPLLPTTPFLIAAAFLFARPHPQWEQRLLTHPALAPAIRAWIDHQAIPPIAKRLATVPLLVSAVGGGVTLPDLWRYLPLACATPVLCWIWTRPSN